jgi:preprotein translocase subunit SecD
MGPVRVLRALAPLALVAGLASGCGSGQSSGPSDSQSGDSTILGASPGFEVRTVYARYTPGVPFGPQLPQALVNEMSSQACPMQPRIVQGLLMECDTGKSVYLLKNPVVRGDVASAKPEQIGHKNLWYVEVKLDSDVAQQVTDQTRSMTGQQLAFSFGGSVLTSLVVDPSFHPGHFAITGDFDKAAATKLAQQLTA